MHWESVDGGLKLKSLVRIAFVVVRGSISKRPESDVWAVPIKAVRRSRRDATRSGQVVT